jgi:hypothetical protein
MPLVIVRAAIPAQAVFRRPAGEAAQEAFPAFSTGLNRGVTEQIRKLVEVPNLSDQLLMTGERLHASVSCDHAPNT